MEKIDKKNILDVFALTPVQEGMLFHYLKEPGSKSYFEQLSLEITGEIDIERCRQAWNVVTKANEMLRTVFRWEEMEVPAQIILKEHSCYFRFHDLIGKKNSQKKTALEAIKVRDRQTRFDLRHVSFRVILCRIEKNEYYLIVSHHHILYDGWSTGIILNEFITAYCNLSREKHPGGKAKTPFKEFINWHHERNTIKEKNFWKNYLHGFDSQSALSIRRKDREEAGTDNYRLNFDRDTVDRLNISCKKHKITLAAYLYTAWGILLQRYSNSNDVVFGTTVSGRWAPVKGIEEIVGLFINTVPLRVYTSRDETTADLVFRIDSSLRTREPYEHSSLVEIKKYSEIDSKQELFDCLLVIENYPLDRRLIQETGILSIKSYTMIEESHYDLTIGIMLHNHDTIDVNFSFKTDCFEKETIIRLAGHFSRLVRGIIPGQGQKVLALEMLSAKEKKQLLKDFNQISADYPRHITIHDLFVRQVERSPDNIALHGPMISGVHEAADITFGELNKRADQLARLLLERGVGPGAIAAIMIERSVEMIIALLGILKTGGAYLPIDPGYPAERIDFMLKDSSANILVTSDSLEKKAKEITKNPEIIFIDSLRELNFSFSHPLNFSTSFPTDLIYIIYTSGSTGRPKGVLIEQKGLVNLILFHGQTFKQSRGIHMSQVASPGFDAMAFEVWPCLVSGAALFIADSHIRMDPGKLKDWLIKNCIAISFQPTVMAGQLLDEEWPGFGVELKTLLTAGDRLTRYPGREYPFVLYNLYGPTEDTVWTTWAEVGLKTGVKGYPSIGRPIANHRVYIVAAGGTLQPVGVGGELCVGGIGLARGYLNNPRLTSERFKNYKLQNAMPLSIKKAGAVSITKYKSQITNKGVPGKLNNKKLLRGVQGGSFLEKSPSNRVSAPRTCRRQNQYRTGDLARWLEDGNIEFLGRIDFQVKIRGFRIEPGEIEHRLKMLDKIKDAVVMAIQDNQAGKVLCAYVVSEKELSVSELRQHLSPELPGYMIPAFFKQVEEIPLTPGGKVDRRALISMGKGAAGPGTGVEYVSPQTEIETKILETWSDLLGKPQESIGIHDNFFDLGGHSLLLIRLNSRLARIFKKDIPMVTLFNHPTISSQARYLSGQEKTHNLHYAQVTRGKETGRGGVKIDVNRAANIAVIGMACRFPGARNIEEFWNNLKNGIEAISFFSAKELADREVDAETVNDPDYVPVKGILAENSFFDSLFFDYTPAEAGIMDPQVRIFHECVWEALENAGYDPDRYEGSIGLYAGATPNPFWEILPVRCRDNNRSYPEQWNALQFSDKDYLSTRVAYKLNLRGPGVTLQTACSTSLTALDQACRGLLSGASHMALAGGVSVTLQDEAGYLYYEGTIMSPDGHCRAFAADARGTVGGNGAGVVVLKPLQEALADNDHIYAVIKGLGINNDGKNKVGFTAPSVEGQAAAIRAAMTMAGVSPDSIGYIEAHGTGTPLGDPIEIQGLKMAFAAHGGTIVYEKKHCALGSVKSNIGHLDAAAGIAGFIKTVLALKHKLIPPSLHFEQPNPNIDFSQTPFYVNTRLLDWSSEKYPLRAGVSSFGLGGTNVHIVLEEVPQPVVSYSSPVNVKGEQPRLLLFSARTRSALDRITDNLAGYLAKHTGINLADAAYTLQFGRKAFPRRGMLVCCDGEQAIHRLKSGSVDTGTAKKDTPTVIFMFSGQGSQYVDMGLDLYKKEPIFRRQVDECFQILEGITGMNMKPVLYPCLSSNADRSPGDDKIDDKIENKIKEAEEKIYQFLYTTPIKFIFEYSLAILLIRWGIQPDAMIGHSFGEYAAACLSGVFSLEDALFMSALRGQLMHRLPAGAMLSVPLSEEELKPLIRDFPGEISLAAVNGDSMCVVSGATDIIEAFERQLNEAGHETLRYQVPKAGHSHMVEPIMAEFKKQIAGIRFNDPKIPYISGMTGKWLTPGEVMNPDYWTRHLRETVRFADGLTTLLQESNPVFLQVGPGRGLILFVNHHPDKKPGTPAINPVRHRKEKVPDDYYFLNQLGQLWLNGVPLDGPGIYPGRKDHRIPLPTYPFEGKNYPAPKNLLHIDKGTGHPDNSDVRPLLTTKFDMADWFYIPVWEESPLHCLPVPAARQKRSNWLIFLDEGGLGDCLANRLQETAGVVVTVKSGEEYIRLNKNSYTINPGQEDDYHRLFLELRDTGRVPHNILHLWSVMPETDSEPQQRPGLEELDRIQELGFFSLLNIVQALGREKISNEIQIYAVTNNMQSVSGEEETRPEKATIRGAVKIIPLEYVNLSCTGVDISWSGPGDGSTERVVELLLKEFAPGFDAYNREKIVALRGNRRWCEKMKPLRLEKSQQVVQRLKERGVYLITGGFGGMGFTFAQYLAQQFRAKLILVKRSFFPAREEWPQWLEDHPGDDAVSIKIRKIQQWEAGGAEILVFNADISDEHRMRAVISEAQQRFGPINGVLHTAGLGDYAGVIRQRTREMTERVMAPKVRGTLVLDRILEQNSLDFLVLFSSIGNIIYQVKFAQVGYNAANEFLEAFAYYKTRKDGTYTVTINWSDWLEVGMAIDATNRKYRKHWKYKTSGDLSGIDYESAIHAGLTPAQGVEILGLILGNGMGLERITVSMVDLVGMVRVLRSLRERDSVTLEEIEEHAVHSKFEKRPMLGTAYEAPADPLEQALAATWSNYFGIEPIGTADDFFELGGDSLKAMIMIHKIHKDLEVRIPLADFFNNPTIKSQAEYIRKAEKKTYASIPLAEEKEYYPLSPAQQRIYIPQRMQEDSTGYNISNIVMLEGEILQERMEEVFFQLLKRHESLRTSFLLVNDEPVQVIHDDPDFAIEYSYIKEVQARIEPGKKVETAGFSLSTEDRIKDFIRPFDLAQAPLLRVGLLRVDECKHLLMVDMHHIIADGTSVDIFIMDFIVLYSGRALAELKCRYRDYSQWQTREKQTASGRETARRQKEYWLSQLYGEIPVLDLPVDYQRPPLQDFTGSTETFKIEARETRSLKTLASQEEATLFTVLLAIFYSWLSRLSGQEDILAGTVSAGRKHENLQPVVGMFVNTLVLRNFTGGEKTFCQFLEEIKKSTLAAFENQDCPFEELVENVITNRDPGRNPLFDTAFILQNRDMPELHIPGLKLIPCEYERLFLTAKFDLSLTAVEEDEILNFSLEYRSRLFKKTTILRFICYFHEIVASVIENPGKKIARLNILPGEERRQVLVDFNDTSVDFPGDKTIHELFREQAGRTPHRVALVGTGWDVQLTYEELEIKSRHLARVLYQKGVRPDSVVGLMVGRSRHMIIGILAILKAGGAYLPIDVEYPGARKTYILKDSAVNLLLTDYDNETGETPINPCCVEVLDLRDEGLYYPDSDSNRLPHTGNADNLVYVIYTSGSTGKPKGVLLKHRNLVNLLQWNSRFTNMDFSSVLQFATICFDASFHEIFSTLLSGGKLCLIGEETRLDIPGLFKVIERHRVKTVFLPMAVLKIIFTDEGYSDIFPGCVTHIQTAGEQVVVSNEFRNYLRENKIYLHNHYGPTEAHVVTALAMAPGEEIPMLPPIGKPVSNTGIYILDKYENVQPLGVSGELYIGGVQVARGYLNKPELTSKKFILCRPGDLFIEHFLESARKIDLLIIYRTGDLARWLVDGNIEFLGRIDHQVKIRGFRVELGEIESHLLNYPFIKEAVVVARSNDRGDRDLYAYLTAESKAKDTGEAPGTPDTAVLHDYLAASLPAYMMPSYFVWLAHIPLLATGKINREALPLPDTEQRDDSYAPPRDKKEKKLVEIWSKVLNLEKTQVGIDSNFFKIGGHSLKAVKAISRIHKEFQTKLPLSDLFKMPTIRRLSAHIRGDVRGRGEDTYSPINPVEKRNWYALSSTQQRLYFLHQMAPESTGYNMSIVFALEGDIEKNKIEFAVKKLISRHESLRTWFTEVNESPVQRVSDKVEFEVEYFIKEGGGENYKLQNTNYKQITNYNFQKTNKEGNGGEVHGLSGMIHGGFIRPFDLSRAPLLRVGMIREGERKSLLLFDIHHIISDGVSEFILSRDFMALYPGGDLPGLRLQYRDFTQWQNRPAQRAALEKQKNFWLKQFQGEISQLNLPVDCPRPKVRRFAGSMLRFGAGEERTRQLKQLAAEENATLFMLLSAVFNIFLAKICGQEEVIVGSPVAGRRHIDLQEMAGFFVNTLPLRNRVIPGKTSREFLTAVKTLTARALENQDYPFEELVEQLAIKRDTSRNPLFDVVFAILNFQRTEIKIPGLTLKPYELDTQVSRFDLSLQAMETGSDIVFIMEYSTDIFKAETAVRFKNYFLNLLEQVCMNPDISIHDPDMLPGDEKQRLLIEFNDTESDFPAGKTIHELFAEQVERTPDHAALVAPGTVNVWHDIYCTMTYRHLQELSGQLAAILKEKGVRADTPVGIKIGRSLELIIGLLGIIKAGGAFLPVDPGYPQERVDFMLKDSNAGFLLTGEGIDELKWQQPSQISRESAFSHRQWQSVPAASSAVYIIYTSGSTGRPKGVVVEHGSLVNLCCWHINYFSVTAHDRASQYAGISFDASVWEVFPYLVCGAAVYIIPEDIKLDIHDLNFYFEKNHITIGFLPTQMCELFMDIDNRSLRVLLTGGDKLKRFVKGRYQLFNNYGPTENTVVTTSYPVTENCENLPIGKPINNNQIYILDRYNCLQPIGTAGELCVGGSSLARGYLNQVELTNLKYHLQSILPGALFKKTAPGPHKNFLLGINQKLLPGVQGGGFLEKNPPGSRKIYKTGDLVRWLAGGNIEFLGRIDQQVKIRGYRIEVGEIENRLLGYENIKEVVVIGREREDGEKYLCAYFVPGGPVEIPCLKEYLSVILPDYMIPGYFVRLERIPLTPGGKLDWKVLPEPGIEISSQYTAPGDELERHLQDIWAGVLGVKVRQGGQVQDIGIDDNFFDRGGHSLTATVLVSRIHRALNIKIPLPEVFSRPTIRGMAEYIKTAEKSRYSSIKSIEKKEYYPVSSAQKRMFMLNRLKGETDTSDNTLSVMIIEGNLDRNRFENVVSQLIKRHEALRTGFELIAEEPVQRIRDRIEFKTEYIEAREPSGAMSESNQKFLQNKAGSGAVFSKRAPGRRRQEWESTIKNFIRPFDLSRAPLLRVGLVRAAPARHLFMHDMHHIIKDGISSGIFAHEFSVLYGDGELAALRIQYKDFSVWQNRMMQTEYLKKQENYWLGVFSGNLPLLNLPLDFPRPVVQSYEGETIDFQLDTHLTGEIKKLAGKIDGTLYIVLLAILNILLSKYSGQEDIVVGTSIAGRTHADLEGIIGFFVNTLAMRNYPKREMTIGEFLEDVRDNSLKAYENQDYQFEELVRKLGIKRDPGRNPLFDVHFTVQNTDIKKENHTGEIGGIIFKQYPYEEKNTQFDIIIHAVEVNNVITAKLRYCTKLFEKQSIEQFIADFKSIAQAIVENPLIKPEDIRISHGLYDRKLAIPDSEFVF